MKRMIASAAQSALCQFQTVKTDIISTPNRMDKDETVSAESLAVLQRETSTSKAAYRNWKTPHKNASSMKWNADHFGGFSATGNEWKSSYKSEFENETLASAPRAPPPVRRLSEKNLDHFEINKEDRFADITETHYQHEFTKKQSDGSIGRVIPTMRAKDNNKESAQETIRQLEMENLELKRALKWYKQEHARLTGQKEERT